MDIIIQTPFSVAVTVLVFGVAFGIAFAFTAYGVCWRSLLKPRLEAKEEQLKSAREHLDLLRARAEEHKATELIAFIAGLKEVIADRDSQIAQLKQAIAGSQALSAEQRRQLEEQIATLETQRRQFAAQIEQSETEDVDVSPGVMRIVSLGPIQLMARNLSHHSIAIRGVVSDGARTSEFAMRCPPVRFGVRERADDAKGPDRSG